MLNAILKGKFKKEDEQKIISEVEMLASRNANTIPKVILSYDTRSAEVSLWKQLENDLDEQKRDLLEEFEHETINKQSSKKSLLAQKKAQQLQSAAKVNPLNEDKTKPEPNTDTNPGLKSGTQKDVEIPEDVVKQQTDDQPQTGQTPSNPTGAPKQDLSNSNPKAPSKPELGQPPVTQLPGQEAKPPITDNKDPVKKSQVEDPKHIKPPTEVKVDPEGATKLDKDAPVDKVQDKEQDKAKGQDAGPTVPKPDAKKSSNLPKSPNAELVAPVKTGQPQPKPKKD